MTVQEIAALSLPEKIQLVEDIWDSVVVGNANVPIPDWQQQELKRRRQNFLNNPASGLTWQEVKRSVLESHAC